MGRPGSKGDLPILLAPVTALLVLVFFVPLSFVLFYSVYDNGLTAKAFVSLAKSTLFLRVLGTSFDIALSATAVSLLLGYPIALHLARQPPRRRALLMILVLLPFWTSILVKSFAFYIILGNQGIINQALRWVFGEAAAVKLLFNRVGVIVGMSHYLIPFVVFPALASLLAQNPDLRRAAQIMGAGPVRIFLRITLPLSMPGVIAGGLMSMVISLGVFVTPTLLGGKADMMMANLIDFYTRDTLDWNTAAAIAVILLALSGILIAMLSWVRRDDGVA
ncbi:MAG: ABC transporter permease [Alphaproteobacteria bacterium]|nr:ABC transporter permease [Alphaproteobacteria bacterium]